MRYLKLTVAYRGTHFCGWQIQDGQPSIQQSLESAFQQVIGETVRVTGSGRTDSGVHAIGQVASVCLESPMECFRLLRALNATTPDDITVTEVEEAADGFHAIRDAKRKRYRYRMQPGILRDPLELDCSWFIPKKLDYESMQNACKLIEGEHDFACFQAAGAQTKSSIRTIYECTLSLSAQGPFEILQLEIEGNGFLYNMVRNIVGSLVEIGKGKKTVDWISELIEGRDRKLAGETAPAQGLFLVKVDY